MCRGCQGWLFFTPTCSGLWIQSVDGVVGRCQRIHACLHVHLNGLQLMHGLVDFLLELHDSEGQNSSGQCNRKKDNCMGYKVTSVHDCLHVHLNAQQLIHCLPDLLL